MKRNRCSNCNGSKWDETLKSVCPECQGVGSFPHWKDGMDAEKARSHLDATVNLLRRAKEDMMDYVSGGREAHDRATQESTMERLRWTRDYWAFRVQVLQGEIALMEGGTFGQSVTASH